MSLSPLVLIVGSLMQDLTLRCSEFPRPGETIMARLATGQGGKGSNQAIACGRVGIRTAFVGATGPGSFAQDVADFYRREKIECHLALKRKASTGTAVIVINHEGQNQIVIEPGANEQLALRDVPRALISRAKVVVTQLESNLRTTSQVLRFARAAKVTTILNPAPMRADFTAAMLRDVDILIPNETEFVALAGQLLNISHEEAEGALQAADSNTLHALCRRFGVPTVIVTLGSRGSFVSEPNGAQLIPAYQGVRVVDTTGAGDAFCGGFAAGLILHQGQIVEAARIGTAVAALSITKPGAAFAMPKGSELKRFLRSKQPLLPRRAVA